MEGLVSRVNLGERAEGLPSSSSTAVIEDDEDIVSVSASTGMRSSWSVLNGFTLGEHFGVRGGARNVGTTMCLNPFVSSKQKYPKI